VGQGEMKEGNGNDLALMKITLFWKNRRR